MLSRADKKEKAELQNKIQEGSFHSGVCFQFRYFRLIAIDSQTGI